MDARAMESRSANDIYQGKFNNVKNWLLYGSIIALLLLRPKKASGGTMFVLRPGKHKGIKNNNPGNLRISNNQWKGKIPVEFNSDGSFEQFETMFYGVRAALKNMMTQYTRGNNTVRKLILKWAPYSDNPVDAVENYIKSVSLYAGLYPDKVFVWDKKNAVNIAYAMFKFENGGEIVDKSIINAAYDAI